MRLHELRFLPTSLFTCSLLALGACGDDSGTGTGSAGDTTVGSETENPPGTTETPADSTAGPEETTTDNPPTTADTTVGEEESSGNPPSSGLAFRLNSLSLTDPNAGLGGDCGGNNSLVNGLLADGVTMDGDGDGDLDSGFVLVFEELDQSDGATGTTAFANASCVAPDGATCSLLADTMIYPAGYTVMQAGVCLEADPAVADTTATGTTSGPCFVTEMADVLVVTSSFSLPLSDARIAAQFVGDPAGNLVSGTMEGFLSEQDASNTEVEFMGIPLALSTLLCAGDTDVGGWWMHMNFTALPTDWQG